MLSDRDLHEAKTLVHRIQFGSVDRGDWANLAALMLMTQPTDALIAIASDGFDQFLLTTKPIYVGHGFEYDDFRRIFDRVCACAARSHGTAS